MSKITIQNSRNKVDKAGKSLIRATPESTEYQEAMEVLSNWRAVHSYPINTFQSTLRDKLKSLKNENPLVAQRLKRTPSIILKLRRFPKMNLSRMQDIGGIRAVLRSTSKVYELYDHYKNRSNFKHILAGEDDYIARPKPSGYRGVHLMYKYRSTDREDLNGLLIEIQIRTKLQHAWATAVETMETFTQTALKSSIGPQEWLSFFAYTGSAFAYIEGTPVLSEHVRLSKRKVFNLVKKEAKRLRVIERLQAFTVVTDALITSKVEKRGRKGHFHLITLDMTTRKVSIQSYGKIDLQKATEDYTQKEKQALLANDGSQVVLVQNISLKNLRKAYPNYFLDSQEFIRNISQIIGRQTNKKTAS